MPVDDEPGETSEFSPDETQRQPTQSAGEPPDATQRQQGVDLPDNSLDPTKPHPRAPSAQQPAPSAPKDPSPDVVPGIVLDGRYRLEEMLGRGATAEVYRGLDELLGRSVAVKVFHRGISDATTLARQRGADEEPLDGVAAS